MADVMKVLIYRGTQNLGDAIQAVAISRLLGTRLYGVYRDRVNVGDPSVPLVINGWIGESVALRNRHCLFAGVHIGCNTEAQLAWIKTSVFPVGSRDPATALQLKQRYVPNDMIGCATMTFARYTGPDRDATSLTCQP